MNKIIKKTILLFLVTYLFLLSINLMGGSFKMFGKEFAESLINITTNPWVGLFIGVIATAVVQSSSCTTSIVVGLVAGGALTISNAIPLIMGANIGTTITNTIVSLVHRDKKEFRQAFAAAVVHDFFNMLTVIVLFPLELAFGILEKSALFITSTLAKTTAQLSFTSPLTYLLKPVAKLIQGIITNPLGLLILSIGLLFISLNFFVKLARPLADSEFKHLLHKHIFNNPMRAFGFGLLLTAFVQSSSVTTSLVVPFVGIGLLTVEKIFPYVVGSNVGTTLTALLASLATGSGAAITVALTHFLFNIFGISIVYPFKKIPIMLADKLSHLTVRSRLYPIGYILFTFFLVPGLFIYFL